MLNRIWIIVILFIFIVGGFFAWQYFGALTEKVIEDETASWQTYRNERFGFEIRYPNDWFVEENKFADNTIEFGESFEVSVKDQKQTIRKIGLSIKVFGESMGMKWPEATGVPSLEEFVYTGFFPINQSPQAVELKQGESIGPVVFGSGNYEGLQVKLYKEVGIPKLITRVFAKKDADIYEFEGEVPTLSTQDLPTAYNYDEVFNQILSTFRFIEGGPVSSLDDDDLLHKLFPSLEFRDGRAISLEESEYGGMGLSLFLDKKIEDYFVDKKEKSLLFIVSLTGVAHAGGLYHSYLGLFDANGNLLTPPSVFPAANKKSSYGKDYYDFGADQTEFGADKGEFGFYDCNGIKYILFVYHGCPNGTCCDGSARLFRINNGNFENLQTINRESLTQLNGNPLSIISFANAAAGPDYDLKMMLSGDKLLIKKVPPTSDTGCFEADYKELKWNKNSCRFE